MTTELFGLDIPLHLPDDTVAIAATVIVDYIDTTDTRRLLIASTDMPLWHRIGMLRAALAGDETDIADELEPDEQD